MAEVGPSFDTSGLALKSEVPTAATVPPGGETTSAPGVRVSVIALQNSAV